MTDTFISSPLYLHSFTEGQSQATSGFEAPSGITGTGFMVGEDGNHYFMTYPFQIEGSTHTRAALGCAETGVTLLLEKHQFESDAGLSLDSTGELVKVPIAGTKYFWAISVGGGAAHGYTFRFHMLLYKIVDDTTLTAVRSHYLDVSGLQSIMTEDFWLNQYNPYTKTVRCGNFIRNSHVIEGFSLVWFDLAATEDLSVPAFDNYHYIEDYDYKFFDFMNFVTNGVQNEDGCITMAFDPITNTPHVLAYVSAAGYSAVQATPTHSGQWSQITQVGVYKFHFGTTESANPNGEGFVLDGAARTTFLTSSGYTFTLKTDFSVSDAGKKHDGTANNPPSGSSNRAADDYNCISAFQFHGTQYVIMTRSYTSQTDLALAGSGTYCKYVIYSWDGSSASAVKTDETSLFDMQTDAGSSLANKNKLPPRFIQVGQVGDDLWFIFGTPSIVSGMTYVIGHLVTGTHVDVSQFHVYFSEFRDSGYVDWSSTFGTDFVSFLDTWYALQDDAALWMQAPWVITYIMSTDDLGSSSHPALNMTPRWEWTDSVGTHKWGQTEDCYRARSNSSVLDVRHRVRGKGRALQLHYESVNTRPFNLLGWSINIDRNASP